MPRIRRPLLALIALVVAAAIGYGVNAVRSHDSPARPPSTPVHSSTAPRSPAPDHPSTGPLPSVGRSGP